MSAAAEDMWSATVVSSIGAACSIYSHYSTQLHIVCGSHLARVLATDVISAICNGTFRDIVSCVNDLAELSVIRFEKIIAHCSIKNAYFFQTNRSSKPPHDDDTTVVVQYSIIW